MRNKNVHALFLKYPEAGRVKTRLGDTIGMEKAAEIYRFLADRIIKSCVSDKYDTIYFIDSEKDTDRFRLWLGENAKIAVQRDGDLGSRLDGAFRYVFDMGYEKCAVTGSDIFGLDSSYADMAFDALDTSECAIGRAEDGGYYLISFASSSYEPAVFYDIIWSTSTVLDETVKKLQNNGKTYQILPELPDIDTEDDLKHLKGVYFG
ncbi:MAG: TIGR04282 family arsenosugar biosynthesis glycosyltransferase [Deferribacterales bacterium]